jgi:hypothetical protein
MEKEPIQTNMLDRRVLWKVGDTVYECTVVGVWLQKVIEGRDYPYNDGRAVVRVFFLLQEDDGSFREVKAIDTKAVLPQVAER